MRWLLFLARVAFICNLFFVLCLLLRHTHFTVPAAANGFVVTTGWIMSVFFNFIFSASVVIVLIMKKLPRLPFWLLFVNVTLFLVQIFYRILS